MRAEVWESAGKQRKTEEIRTTGNVTKTIGKWKEKNVGKCHGRQRKRDQNAGNAENKERCNELSYLQTWPPLPPGIWRLVKTGCNFQTME